MNTLKLKEYQEQLLQEKKSITESLDYKELSGRGSYLAQDPNEFSRMKSYEVDIKNIDRLIKLTQILSSD